MNESERDETAGGPVRGASQRRQRGSRAASLLPIVLGAAAGILISRGGMPLPWPALLFATFLVLVLPLLSLAQRRDVDLHIREIPRRVIYGSSALGLWVLAAVALLSALASGFTARRMGLVLLEPLPLLGWTAGLSAACLAVPIASRLVGVSSTPALDWILPRTHGEKLGFAGLSATAGVTEEIIFRGFLVPALVTVTGSTAAAVVVSSVAFGSVHAYQGMVGVVRTALIGAVLALSLVATGSLVPAIVAHAVANLVVGIVLVDWFRGGN
jgi:uncharacterized protein